MKSMLFVFSVVVCMYSFGSSWKESADGSWSDETKWDGGVPTSTSAVVLPLFTTSYKVGYGAADAVVAGTVQSLQVSDKANVAEDGRTVSLEITNATLNLPITAASGLKIYRHGKVRIGTGGKLSVVPSTDMNQAVMLNYRGALLHVDGGIFELKGNGYFYNCNGWSSTINQEPPEVRISSGEFNITRTTGGFCYYGYGYGKCTMTGGTMNLANGNAYNAAMQCYSDGVGLDLSGDAVLNVNKGTIFFSRGTFNVGGNAKLKLNGYSHTYFYLGNSDTANKSATLNLKDDCEVDMYDTYGLQVGSSAADKPTISTMNISGGHHRFGFFNIWGCGPNKTTVSISNGATVMIPRVGISVGSPRFSSDYGAGEAGSYATGTVRVANGVLSVGGDGNNASYATARMIGFILGNGTVSRDSGAWYAGSLDVSGSGIVTNGLCPFVVGIGLGEGHVTQSGGLIYSTGEYGREGEGGGPRGSFEAKPVVIGSFGARGDYTMSGGASTFQASVFLGGIESNKFIRTFCLPSLAYRHRTAVGTLCVTGGTFWTKGGMYVGLDGTGILQAGGAGKVKIGDTLVLSNAIRSVVKVFPRFDGTAPIDIGGNLVITDGAELEIDARSVPEDVYGKFPLIACKSQSGMFDPAKVTIVGGSSDGKLVTRTTAAGVELCYHKPRGLVMIVR